ncbi:MAG: protein-(glutamine-N5) methyltransferase, release factor-specific [Nitrospinae bacterium RIFCSPLOWO2_01_FULL_39_10]|nr:MAG: protein-(glutamine-N5) methyltransferase, release factor-specific [Nitrospinae bacterium RIFCSPLOWO2_01_FULL_39_10]
MNTIRDILNWAAEYLKSRNIPSDRLDSEVLLSFILNKDRTYLYTNSEKPILPEEHKKFKELIERRGRREPLSYITGEKEFWSLKFKVSRDTLIPRPETEILVQAVLDIIKYPSPPPLPIGERIKVRGIKILDIGTGSGNVAVSIAKESPESHVFTVDKSNSALSVAKENAIIHNVAGRITFLKGDLCIPFNPPSPPFVKGGKEGLFDIIVSNPPYIPTGDIEGLMPEVRDWEPRWALDGGKDGLEIVRKIIKDAPLFLKSKGFLAMEIGFGQSEEVSRIISETDKFHNIKTIKDLSGIERVVTAWKR